MQAKLNDSAQLAKAQELKIAQSDSVINALQARLAGQGITAPL